MKGNFTILYGDIVRLGQLYDSIENTNEFKNRHKSTIYSLAEKYDGELLEHFTDSTKIIFKHTENALRFATELFNNFSLEPRIPYRIGISYGFVEYDNNGIYGLPAQVAAQLINICTEGAVLLSEEVSNQVEKGEKFSIRYVGQTYLKGNNSPVQVHCLASKNLYVPSQAELTEKARNKNSIAVLPFHNTSSEKELDYICDGIAEEVIDSLSKAKDLFVTARSSSFMFKNKDISIQDISRKLNVTYVLDGSIRKRNNQYRISYQLVDCSNGYNIISDTITSDFDTLYDSETRIVKSIINYFKNDEPVTGRVDLNDIQIDPRAYSYYLQGKHLSQEWNSDSAGAIKLFKKAIEIVPDYAIAYAGMSICYTHLALNGYGDFRENITHAVLNAEKSIALDNTIPDGYTAKALAAFWMGNWFIPDFEKNLTTALAISPCNAEIRMFNGMVFLIKGELKRALSELKLARQLDPLSASVNIRLGLVQYLNRNYEDAHNTYLTLLNEDVNKTYNLLRLACCSLMLKQYSIALEYLNMSDDNYEYYQMKYGIYLAIYKGLKDEDNFFKTKEIIEQLPENDTSTFYNKAVLNKLLGNHERSIQYLEKMLRNPLFFLMFLQHDEFWEEFHEHPLFIELIASKYKGTGNQLIKIESDTKEFVELKLTDFLYAEAQDNYTLIVYKEDKRKKEKILRATLANIEKQLSFQDVIRCHRSYIINLGFEYAYHKSDNKASLKNIELDISIPVSRSKEKEIKELLSDKQY